MARTSFKRFRRYLGLPGAPVEWTDRYFLSEPAKGPEYSPPQHLAPLQFAEFRDRILDITPHPELLPAGATPFPTAEVRRGSSMQFNVADYGHTLMADFLAAGGRVERREFHSLGDLTSLKQKVVINCPGYGARALCRDETITPVRGQIAWLIPQPEVTYGVIYQERQHAFPPRRHRCPGPVGRRHVRIRRRSRSHRSCGGGAGSEHAC